MWMTVGVWAGFWLFVLFGGAAVARLVGSGRPAARRHDDLARRRRDRAA